MSEKRKIEKDLQVAVNSGQITPDSKSMVIANLNATTLPGCIGAPTDMLGTTYPAIVKLIVDASGTMTPFRFDVIDALNKLKARIESESNRTGSEVLLSVSQFEDVVRLINSFEHVDTLADFGPGDYDTGGLTALFDATYTGMVETVSYGSSVFGAGATGNQQVVIILSDGRDNSSAKTAADVADFLSEFTGKRNFVIVFIGFGAENVFRPIAESMGIPSENVRVYDPNQPDFLDAVVVDISSGIASRSQKAGMGQAPSGDFFVT
jgi:hypothetical protein